MAEEKKTKVMPEVMRFNKLLEAHRMEDMKKENRIKHDQLRALKVIDGMGEIPVRKLNFILQVPPPIMHEVVKGLEEEGLVKVTQPDPEKKKRILSITDAGKEKAAVKTDGPGRIFSVLSDEEKAQLAALLGKVSDNLASELGLPEDRKEQMKALREREKEAFGRGQAGREPMGRR